MCLFLFFSSRRWHTICALVTGVQTCALPISRELEREAPPADLRPYQDRFLQLNPPPASPEPGEVLGLDGERGRAADARRTLENGGLDAPAQIGRASCRGRVCQYVLISVVAVSLKKKKR